MPRLLGRRVVVELGTEAGVGKRLEGMRVGFDVDMNDGSEPNEARIEVYGVGRETVALMQQENALVRLHAGYDSLGGPLLLFQGNPVDGGVKLDRRGGVDRVLVIEAQDGGKTYGTSHTSVSYTTAITSGVLFAKLAADFGRPLGNVDAVVGNVSFPYGVNLAGPTREIMDRVARMSGAQWQFRDGALQVWATGGTTGEQAVLFSASNGNLIDSPKPTDDGIEVVGLLAPTLRPGKPFRVESEDYQGNYTATEVRFRGDSGWAREFYVIAKGTPI